MTFPAGIFAKKPHANAPDFVKAKVSIKIEDAIKWLEAQKPNDDWVNLDLKESKEGKFYLVVDDWKPDPNRQTSAPPPSEGDAPPLGDDDLPF